MDSKFKKAENWDEFRDNYYGYIIVLSEAKNRGEMYNMIVKDWAEYSVVNKEYIHSGARYFKASVGKQMMSLLLQGHHILEHYLDIFYSRHHKDKVQDFSKLRAHIDNELAFKKQVEEEKRELERDEEQNAPSEETGDVEENLLTGEHTDGDSKEEKRELEQIVTDTLVGGAKMIGKLVEAVDGDIRDLTAEISSMGKSSMVKVKVVGPKKIDFLDDILDFLPSEDAGVIETEADDYDVGVYAFTHENWGDLEKVKDMLPTGKYRIACNVGRRDGDICMDPLFFDVWEFEKYGRQDILRKLRRFV